MSETVIKVENLSKQYRLGMVGAGTLREDLVGWWYRLRGKEDPYLTVGETNDRAKTGNSDYVWALRDVNFEVQQGEVLGIIGKNGAGKSTLLKLLSRVTAPTTGSIKAKGRIASLLEVGTGFHPELTGRENIYLNGAIMGMRRSEITRKLDEIIDFAGVQRYVDTPVKRYSSGMYVRLAFAVAAHLEPEILIVDEVLAVGDAEFQRKALGKMEDVSKGQGRTVLFVSHNMASVKSLCKRTILMEKGYISNDGNTDSIIAHYIGGKSQTKSARFFGTELDTPDARIESISVYSEGKNTDTPIREDSKIHITTNFFLKNPNTENYHLTFHLLNGEGEALFSFAYGRRPKHRLNQGKNCITCMMPHTFLQSGEYFLSVMVIKARTEPIILEKNALRFIVVDRPREPGSYLGREPGHIRPTFEWQNSVEDNLS